MVIPTKKLKNGFEMPIYGLGTWQMGGRNERDPQNNDEADVQAIQAAIDLGVTHIDTAEIYANGYSEILVSQAIKKYDRKKLFLVSKVYLNNMRYDDLINACKQSLERLQTSYLDLYLLHRYPGEWLQEAVGALDTLLKQGLIKNIGVSNFNVERMQEAQALTKNKIVANQVHLNVKYREAEVKGVLQYCQENDLMLIAWRPLQKGNILDRNPLIESLCQKYNKTPAQIALNWLISQQNIVTLSKTTNIEHLKENLGAVGWNMEQEDIIKIRREFPGQEAISDAVSLE